MDWRNFVENIGTWFNIFIEWYLEQPLYGQVLVIIGIIAVVVLVVTLVYYIIKGIAYLIYYIFKGIFYLLKYIGYGFYKLFEGFYLLVSGKSKSQTQKNTKINIQDNIPKDLRISLEYCIECGKRVTSNMKKRLQVKGIVFCVNCGARLRIDQDILSLSISY